jgi:hypothetical protein
LWWNLQALRRIGSHTMLIEVVQHTTTKHTDHHRCYFRSHKGHHIPIRIQVYTASNVVHALVPQVSQQPASLDTSGDEMLQWICPQKWMCIHTTANTFVQGLMSARSVCRAKFKFGHQVDRVSLLAPCTRPVQVPNPANSAMSCQGSSGTTYPENSTKAGIRNSIGVGMWHTLFVLCNVSLPPPSICRHKATSRGYSNQSIRSACPRACYIVQVRGSAAFVCALPACIT